MTGFDQSRFIGMAFLALGAGVMFHDCVAARSATGASSPSPPPPTGLAKRPQPNGRPGEWVSDNDYPTRALQLGVSGTVHFRLTIAKDGIPTACEVVGESVSAELDATTCTLVMKRGRFFPATDTAGRPVIGIYSSYVKWALPTETPAEPQMRLPIEAQPVPVTHTWQLAYDVKADGQIANCTLKLGGFTPAEMAQLPGTNEVTECRAIGRFAPPHDASGKPSQKHVVINKNIIVSDLP